MHEHSIMEWYNVQWDPAYSLGLAHDSKNLGTLHNFRENILRAEC